MVTLPVLQHQPHTFLPQEEHSQSSNLPLRLREQECVSLIKKCRKVIELKQVHAQMMKLDLFSDSFCLSNLIATCAITNWGNMYYASKVFDQVDHPCTFDYNNMIRGYVKDGNFETALQLFINMLQSGNLPDNFTYPFVLKSCSALSLLELGMQIHGHVYKLGFTDCVFVQNSLINMYGKCWNIKDSCVVFEEIEQKSAASWSSLVGALANLGMWWDCVGYFREMMRLGSCKAEESILVSLISACTHLGTVDLGKSVHGYLLRNFNGLNVIVETSLMDMYMKCVCVEKGLHIFERMSGKNRFSYSVMLSGLAIHGYGHEALELFSCMLEQGIKPDDAIYLGVLSACRHAGLVEEGLKLLDKMRVEHQIEPTIQHYGCVLDLLGRAAMFDEAFDLIEKMPMTPNEVVWRCLLSAARVHGNLEVGERVTRNLMQIGSNNAGDYVMISNMYGQTQRWDDAAIARTMVASRGLDQAVGFSLVEVNRRVYRFVSQDKSRRDWKDIYEMIHQMEWQLKFEGYQPDVSEVVHNVDAEEKKKRLRYKSQKLALAFALINTSENKTIRIVRNVRMCKDSHTYTKFISVVYNRKIIVRDRNRFHHFNDGTCSCRDYW